MDNTNKETSTPVRTAGETLQGPEGAGTAIGSGKRCGLNCRNQLCAGCPARTQPFRPIDSKESGSRAHGSDGFQEGRPPTPKRQCGFHNTQALERGRQNGILSRDRRGLAVRRALGRTDAQDRRRISEVRDTGQRTPRHSCRQSAVGFACICPNDPPSRPRTGRPDTSTNRGSGDSSTTSTGTLACIPAAFRTAAAESLIALRRWRLVRSMSFMVLRISAALLVAVVAVGVLALGWLGLSSGALGANPGKQFAQGLPDRVARVFSFSSGKVANRRLRTFAPLCDLRLAQAAFLYFRDDLFPVHADRISGSR